MTRKNVNGGVQLNIWVNGKPQCSAFDKPDIQKRAGVNTNCAPIGIVAFFFHTIHCCIDNWPEAPGTDTKNAISVSSPYLD